MREIKFRAWDKTDKEMVDYFHIQSNNGSVTVYEYSADAFEDQRLPEDATDHIDYILMQYTGLKDKNGKEIYEGDIVVTHGWQGAIEMSHTGAYVIAQGSFKELLHDYVYNKWDIEVIGNIYEDKELLK